MTYGELPVETEFLFGHMLDYRENRIPMKWLKTAKDNMAISLSDLNMSMDCPRANGRNRVIRNHGHVHFLMSYLCQFLNSSKQQWAEVEDGNFRPRHYQPGFLTRFSAEELKMLLPFNISVEAPTGYAKTCGQTMTKEVLVGIPNTSELGTHSNAGEFGIHFGDNRIWERNISTITTNADTMVKKWQRGNLLRINADMYCNVKPIIKIDPETPVDVDENGCYVLRIPEKDFEGNLDAFFGFAEEEKAA